PWPLHRGRTMKLSLAVVPSDPAKAAFYRLGTRVVTDYDVGKATGLPALLSELWPRIRPARPQRSGRGLLPTAVLWGQSVDRSIVASPLSDRTGHSCFE